MDQQGQNESLPLHIEAMLKDCPALAEAARYGVDIPLLLGNLKLSVTERIQQLQAAADLAEELRKAINS